MRLTESQLRRLIKRELQHQLLREFLDSAVKAAELALKAAGDAKPEPEEKEAEPEVEKPEKTSTSAGGGEVGGSGKMFKTTGKTIKTAAAKAKDVAETGTGALDIAKTPEALKKLQQTAKDFKTSVETAKTIAGDAEQLVMKMPTDKAADVKQAVTKNVVKLQQNVDRYFQDMNDDFEDDPTARVATVAMLAQMIVNLDRAAK